MNIQDIIIKTELTQEEVQFVIEEYIFELKNIRININLQNNSLVDQLPIPIQNMYYSNQLQLMDQAYQIACEYFFSKQD